jgi:hypothetical protein
MSGIDFVGPLPTLRTTVVYATVHSANANRSRGDVCKILVVESVPSARRMGLDPVAY